MRFYRGSVLKHMTRLGVAGLAAAASLAVAAPADATSRVLYHGSDWARTFYINDDVITVNDGEADGHTVWVDYYLNNGSFHRLYDLNGPNNGGAIADYRLTPYWISKFRLCEYEGGCTSYLPTDGLGGH